MILRRYSTITGGRTAGIFYINYLLHVHNIILFLITLRNFKRNVTVFFNFLLFTVYNKYAERLRTLLKKLLTRILRKVR